MIALQSSTASWEVPQLAAQTAVHPVDRSTKQSGSEGDDRAPAPVKVAINPTARDEEIRRRLQSVLDATGWFIDPRVEVRDGVVFLSGKSETDGLKKWAGDLVRNTQDVVAVANRIEVIESAMWDLSPAWNGLAILWRDSLRAVPFVLFGLIILALSSVAGILVTRKSRRSLSHRIRAQLLRTVIARGLGVLIFLCGVYVTLRVSGLTQLALTIAGGTGLVGLAVGIAFRDITENFLASIFLTIQRPFETGDLIEVSGVTGYVQQLNVRTTILMSLDGNFVQIPNATIYKSNIRNFSTNINRREDFVVGIGYEDSIQAAQEIAQQVLLNHPAVLNDPEPSILADSLGTSTVNLRIYFWLNGREHSWLKVRSSVIRQVKLAFQKGGISMPDEVREVVFPRGIPVTLLEQKGEVKRTKTSDSRAASEEERDDSDAASTKAEGGLVSEAFVIKSQAHRAQSDAEAENLLKEGTDKQRAHE